MTDPSLFKAMTCLRNTSISIIVCSFVFLTLLWFQTHSSKGNQQLPLRRYSLSLDLESVGTLPLRNHLYKLETIVSDTDFKHWQDNYDDYEKWVDDHSAPDIPGIWKPRPVPSATIYLFGTKEMQRLIYHHQNPSSCTGQRFAIWGGHPAGVGSMLHVMTAAMACAFNENRIFLVNPSFTLFGGNLCRDGTIFCFFSPLSNCTPADGDDVIHYNQPPEAPCAYRTWPNISAQILLRSPIKPSHYFYWWRAQGVTYFLRPKSWFLDTIMERQKFALSPTFPNASLFNHILPTGTIGIHVRHADKGIEMKLVSFSRYREAVKYMTLICPFPRRAVPANGNIIVIPVLPFPINESTNSWTTFQSFSHPIFVSTDDPTVITELETTDEQYLYLKLPRENRAWSKVQAHAEQEFLDAFANLHLQLQCDCFIGTLRYPL